MRFPLVFLALLVTGCGSLNVQLDALNPAYVETAREQVALQKILLRVSGETNEQLEQRWGDLLSKHRAFYDALEAQYRQDAAAAADPTEQMFLNDVADFLLADFQQVIAPRYAATFDVLKRLDEEIREEYGGSDTPDSHEILLSGRLGHLLRQRHAIETQFRQSVEDDTDGNFEAVEEPDPAVANTKAAYDAEVQRLAGGGSLLSSPLAYAVARAPETEWAPQLNRAFGRGDFGNLNLAIKLQPPSNPGEVGEFTIKGMTFDPGDVAAVAAKATTQALLMSAQIAGVPVMQAADAGGSSSSNTTGSALVASSNFLNQAQDKALKQSAMLDDYNDALLTIATAIIAETDKITSASSATRADAVGALQSIYDAHKSRLQLSTPQ